MMIKVKIVLSKFSVIIKRGIFIFVTGYLFRYLILYYSNVNVLEDIFNWVSIVYYGVMSFIISLIHIWDFNLLTLFNKLILFFKLIFGIITNNKHEIKLGGYIDDIPQKRDIKSYSSNMDNSNSPNSNGEGEEHIPNNQSSHNSPDAGSVGEDLPIGRNPNQNTSELSPPSSPDNAYELGPNDFQPQERPLTPMPIRDPHDNRVPSPSNPEFERNARGNYITQVEALSDDLFWQKEQINEANETLAKLNMLKEEGKSLSELSKEEQDFVKPASNIDEAIKVQKDNKAVCEEGISKTESLARDSFARVKELNYPISEEVSNNIQSNIDKPVISEEEYKKNLNALKESDEILKSNKSTDNEEVKNTSSSKEEPESTSSKRKFDSDSDEDSNEESKIKKENKKRYFY